MFPRPSQALLQRLDELQSRLNQPGDLLSRESAFALIDNLIEDSGPALLPYLLAMVNHPESQIRLAAERAVGALLPALRMDQLVEMESLIRESWLQFSASGNDFRANSIPAFKLSTFAPSGWCREKAVAALTHGADASALPFILLRLNDWVPQVREAATHWCRRCLDKVTLTQLVDALPVLAALNERSLGQASEVVQALIRKLESPDAAPLMLAALPKLQARSRRLAFAALGRGGAFNDPPVQEGLLTHPDAVLGVMLLRSLRMGNPELLEPLLTLALGSKRSLLRRYALFSLSTRQLEQFLPAILNALDDPSHGVREFAQYHLRGRCSPLELQARYTAALLNPASSFRTVAASILGYHETGGRWTASEYLHWSQHPSARVKQAIMKTFAAFAFDEALPWLKRECASAEARGLGQIAATLLSRQPHAVTSVELQSWLEGSQAESVRFRAFKLLIVRGKWERLPLLMRLADDANAELRHKALVGLKDWLATFNRAQIQPSRLQVESALAGLARARSGLEEKLYAEFRSLLQALNFPP